MSKKRIIFVTREIVPFYYGGIGTQFKAVAKFLKSKGHEIYFLTQKHKTFDEVIYKKNYGDIPLFFVNYPKSSKSFHLPFAYSVEVLKKFDDIYSNVLPDIVICADFAAEGYFLFLKSQTGDYEKTRFVLTINGLSYNTISIYESGVNFLQEGELNDPQNRVTCAMEDMSILLADEIITPSALYWKEVQGRLKINKKANVIPNFLDKDLFNLRNVDESGDQRNQVILFIGRLDRIKGADLLIKAYLDMIIDFSDCIPQIIFIGRDIYWKEYESTFLEYWQKRIPRSCIDNILFLGQIDHNKIVAYLNQATVCVFPSRWEVFGIVCLEAMVSGCPVLVSRGTGLEEVLGPSFSNYVFDVTKGEVALKEKLISILQNPSQLKRVGDELCQRANELMNISETRFLNLVEKTTEQQIRSSNKYLKQFYGNTFQIFSALDDIIISFEKDYEKIKEEVAEFEMDREYLRNEIHLLQESTKLRSSSTLVKVLEKLHRRVKWNH